MRNQKSEYPLLCQRKPPSLQSVLSALYRRGGAEAFFYPEKLREELSARGLPEAETDRVLLFTQAGGFRAFVTEKRIERQALNRFLTCAVQETELSRKTVQRLACDFARATGCRVSFVPWTVGGESLPAIYPVDPTVGADTIKRWARVFQAYSADGPDVPREALSAVEPWVAAGFPEAQYLYGQYLLRRFLADETLGGMEEGVWLLWDAAGAGESRAAAALGEFYYSYQSPAYWREAFQLFTVFGSPALTASQHGMVLRMMHQRRFHGDLLKGCVLLLAVLCALLSAPYWHDWAYPPQPVPDAAAAAALAVMFLCGVVWFCLGNPYSRFYRFLPFLMILSAALYCAGRVFLWSIGI